MKQKTTLSHTKQEMKSRRPAGKDDPTRVRELGTTAALVDQQPVVVVTAVVVAPASSAGHGGVSGYGTFVSV